jgi:hypothetical protein
LCAFDKLFRPLAERTRNRNGRQISQAHRQRVVVKSGKHQTIGRPRLDGLLNILLHRTRLRGRPGPQDDNALSRFDLVLDLIGE